MSGPEQAAVATAGLVKQYGEITAVDGVSLEVEHGEIFAFLGPNGAGKSTTIRMLCTLTRPTSGRAWVAGVDVATDPRTVRRRIGLVFQDQTLDVQLTAAENLRFHAALYDVPATETDDRVAYALELVDLSDRADDLVSTFSGGMARRLEIARGLMHAPTVLFLDEPTVGLDPQTRARIWEDVRRLRDDAGVTIFMTTHYMDEAGYADRIAIIDHGRIVALDTPAALRRAVGQDTVHLTAADPTTAVDHLVAAGYDARATSDGCVAFVEDGEASVADLIATVSVPIRGVRVHRPTLDDVFMHFTGRELRDEAPARSPMARAFARRR